MKQYEGEPRTRYLLRVASKYIEDHPEHTIDYDETTCDGGCLSGELLLAYQAWEWGTGFSTVNSD